MKDFSAFKTIAPMVGTSALTAAGFPAASQDARLEPPYHLDRIPPRASNSDPLVISGRSVDVLGVTSPANKIVFEKGATDSLGQTQSKMASMPS